MEPLMLITAEIEQGFQAEHETVTAQLDLTSAYNHVEHYKLLDAMRELGIPPVYARFFKAFLRGRSFRVRFGRALSRWAKEKCGVPQGAVSSPPLFNIYMELIVRSVARARAALNIGMSGFADDYQLYCIGPDLPTLAHNLSEFLTVHLLPALTLSLIHI